MLETNEKYLSQEKLDTLLSTVPPSYKPTEKEKQTIVIYDVYYLQCLWHYLYIITLINSSERLGYTSYGHFAHFLGDLNDCIEELEFSKGQKPKKNPNYRDLTMADYKSDLFNIQFQLKEIKNHGKQNKYVKKYLEKFSEYYKAIQDPIICEPSS